MREERAPRSWRALPVALVTLAILSCDKLPGTAPVGPTGPVGDVARQVATLVAPSADVRDEPFEEFLTKLDLAKTHGAGANEIVDQIRKTRAAVAARAASPSSASGGPRLASLARAVGTFSIPQFAHTFAQSLDGLTKKNETIALPGQPFSSQETGAKSFTTTTLNVTQSFSGTGSKVTGTVRWSYSTITIETQTGATLVHLTDERELVGTIDVCPDAGGGVPGTLKVTSNIVAQDAGATTTRRSDGNSSFRGQVDEQATLRTVTQQQRVEVSTQSTSGNGGYSANNSVTWNAGPNGYLGGFDSGSFSGSLTPNGSTSVADAARAAGWDTALDAYALDLSYQKAQDLWRHGRCVVVIAPDYNAETPIETTDQQRPQHDEEVATGSETKFAVSLKHRFAGALVQPVTAALTSGEKTLEPSRLESVPSSLTYKAPDEEDKKATANLQSTSKRGIGSLVLDFHTGGSLTIEARGTLTWNIEGTPVRYTFEIALASTTFQKRDATTYAAQAPSKITGTLTGLPGPDCGITFSGEGTTGLLATIEKRGDRTVWVVRRDPMTGSETVNGRYCLGAYSAPPIAGGGYGPIFVQTVGDIVIPREGGTVAVSGTRSLAPGTPPMTAQGTVIATVARR